MLTLLLRHLLIIFHRELTHEHVLKNEYLDHEMDTATSYFNENYNRDINIEEYATSRGMSVSWFIRNFKKFTGTTPMQFITSIRITNAQMLLETTNYAVNEIARIVGYDNPLYFSRLFHKQKGCSPSEYRKLLKWTNKRGSLSEWFSLESLLILSCYLRHSTFPPSPSTLVLASPSFLISTSLHNISIIISPVTFYPCPLRQLHLFRCRKSICYTPFSPLTFWHGKCFSAMWFFHHNPASIFIQKIIRNWCYKPVVMQIYYAKKLVFIRLGRAMKVMP